MSDKEPFEQDETVAEAFLHDDDITEYIYDESFEKLRHRFAEADEDEDIRNEDFNPLITGRGSKKTDFDELRSSPSFKKDPISEESLTPVQNVFGSAESDFDNDVISFEEIDLEALGDITAKDDAPKIETTEKFNTNTKVIFSDEDADDGIKRNSDIEVTDVFLP